MVLAAIRIPGARRVGAAPHTCMNKVQVYTVRTQEECCARERTLVTEILAAKYRVIVDDTFTQLCQLAPSAPAPACPASYVPNFLMNILM